MIVLYTVELKKTLVSVLTQNEFAGCGGEEEGFGRLNVRDDTWF